MKKSNFVLATFIWLILAVCFIFIRIAASLGWFNFLGSVGASVVTSLLIQVVIMGFLSVFLFTKIKKQPYKQTFKDFSFKKISPLAVVISVLIGVVVYFLNIFVANFFNFILEFFGYSSSAGSSGEPLSVWLLLLVILLQCVLPAIFEEISHRGLLLKGFENQGIKKAIILSGLLFGFMHFNITQFGYAFLIGILLAYLTLLTRSIIPAMIIHFMNNFLATMFSWLISIKSPLGTWLNSVFQSFTGGSFLSLILGVTMILAGLGLLLAALVIWLFRETSLKNLIKETNNLAMKEYRNQFLISAGLTPETDPKAEKETVLMEKEIILDGNIKRVPIKVPVSMLGMKIKQSEKLTLRQKIFFWSGIAIGTVTTIFTFVFGVL